MRLMLIASAALLGACAAHRAALRHGAQVAEPPPQAALQCARQPELEWCRSGAR